MLKVSDEKNKLDEERLATAMELLGGWIWETDAEHCFTFISENFERLIGESRSHFYGKTRAEAGNYCKPAQLSEFEERLAARQGFSSIDLMRTRIDGGTVHMRITGKPVFDASGAFRGYRGVAYCTTRENEERERRVAAEKAQSDLAATLEAVIDTHPDPMIIFDRKLALIRANTAYLQVLGLPARYVAPGIGLKEIVEVLVDCGDLTGDEPEALVERHLRIARLREPVCFERSRANGVVMRVQQIPLPCGGILRTLTDVTERVEDKWTIYALKSSIAALSSKTGAEPRSQKPDAIGRVSE